MADYYPKDRCDTVIRALTRDNNTDIGKLSTGHMQRGV